jgi:hypothetical protein
MTFRGHVRNGVVVFDEAPALPEGAAVLVELIDAGQEASRAGTRRQGDQFAGRIWMAPDFEDWPEDLQEALGMK